MTSTHQTPTSTSSTNSQHKTPPRISKTATSAPAQALTVEETLDALSSLATQAKAIQALVDEHKEHLQSLYDLDQITNKVTHNGITASLVSRTTWKYSDECKDSIKKLQEYDKIEGNATQEQSACWQIRFVKQADE